MSRRSLLVAVAALLAVTACGGGGGEPRPSGPLGDDAFAGEASLIDGTGTVELSAFADKDLVVWFWSPW